MGIFKRVFGKGDKTSDERVEKELEDIKAGKETKVYPILKPGNWVGIKMGALKQTLLGTQEEPQLVVGFGYDAPTNFVFLMPKDLEGKDPNQILQNAYANLETVPSLFAPKAPKENEILTASGNDFSAEKILSQAHMQKAHALLNAKELLVSIPRRRCMMIVSRSAPKEVMSQFIQVHDYTWTDDSFGNAPIINALFVIIDGKIQGLIPLDKAPIS